MLTIKSTVAGLTNGVSAAVSLARHPLSTAANAAGLVKGTAAASIGLVRGRSVEQTPRTDVPSEVATPAAPVESPAQESAPREPQVVPKPVPTIEELPEPIVIHAEDSTGESFHTEPKAASRDSEHGGAPGDREEASGYVEEIPESLDGLEEDAEVVWTSESADAPRG